MKRTQLLFLLLLLTIGGVGGWAAERFFPTDEEKPEAIFVPQIASTQVNIAAVRTLASETCKCEMSGDDAERCNAKLDAELKRINGLIRGDQATIPDSYHVGTACAPVSTSSFCLTFSDKEECFVTGYNVNGASDRNGRQPIVCSAGDAQAIERAFNEAPSFEAGFEAADAALDRILAGESQNYDPAADKGCV